MSWAEGKEYSGGNSIAGLCGGAELFEQYQREHGEGKMIEVAEQKVTQKVEKSR